MDTDVVVVGAGPVGLTLACELRRHGVDVRVLERHERRPEGSRATDLHARSLELWERTGVAGAILARALPIDAGEVDSPMPAAVSLRQRDLEELLEAHLRDAGGVEVEHGVGVTDVATDPGAERGAVVTDTTGATAAGIGLSTPEKSRRAISRPCEISGTASIGSARARIAPATPVRSHSSSERACRSVAREPSGRRS
jgi:2-polyprenyl-6-methoxyphenol hydroxylase-like FAD-dependent oxidoreductase